MIVLPYPKVSIRTSHLQEWIASQRRRAAKIIQGGSILFLHLMYVKTADLGFFDTPIFYRRDLGEKMCFLTNEPHKVDGMCAYNDLQSFSQGHHHLKSRQALRNSPINFPNELFQPFQ